MKDHMGGKSMLEAAAAGDLATLKKLIQGGHDLNAKDKNEGSALTSAAAAAGHVQVVRYLVEECGANVNVTSENRFSALLESAQNGHLAVVQYLVEEHKMDVNAKNIFGATPLMWAAGNGHLDVVRFLADKGGADVNAVNQHGSTALHWAADYGHLEVVRWLAGEGDADVNVVSNDGYTALSRAARVGDLEIVRFLAEECGADVEITTKDGESAIRIAADRGDYGMQRLLARHSRLLLANPSKKTAAAIDILTIPPLEMALTEFVTTSNVGGEYLAKWLDADVVVKLFIPDTANSSFEEEGKVWQQLRHPNVIKMYGACYAGVNDLKFYVCEYACCGSLLEYLKRYDGDTDHSMWKLLHEAALGLEYLHERRIVHGDLRCCNILIGSDGMAKLSSFRLSTSTSTTSSYTGPTQWQAPEVLEGNPQSLASDVYSLGMTILEAITGEIPWYVTYDIWMFTKKNQWEPEVFTEKSEKFAPDCPPGPTRDLIWRMCSKDPNKRMSLSAVVSELERLAISNRSEPEDEPMTTTFNSYKSGQSHQTWTEVEKLMETCENTQHLQAFAELKKIHERLSISVHAVSVLAQCDALITDFRAQISMSPDQSLAIRLSSSKSTSNSMGDFYRRIESLWTSLGVPMEMESTRKVQIQAEDQRRDEFVSGVSELYNRLSDLPSDDEKLAFLMTVKTELENNRSKYTSAQVGMLENIIETIESKLVRDDLTGVLPEWFIPWYELIINESDRLGAGGFGSVYRAKWLDSEVVVKRLGTDDQSNESSTLTSWTVSLVDSTANTHPADSTLRASELAMFRREVDIWFTFRHPHVIQLFGACHVGNPFFVCEYATNGTLVSYLEKHPDELWTKLHEAALGVQYLHARNVVHGDLKGNNIVVGSDKKAKVTDFGLSSLTEGADSAGISGASHWVAPECFQANARPSFESDIYSLGMCVIEALRLVEAVKTGKDTLLCFPWGDVDNTVVKVLAKQGKLPVQPAISSDNQWEFVKSMCAFDPSKRMKISTVVDGLVRFSHERDTLTAEVLSLESITKSIADARRALSILIGNRDVMKSYSDLWDRIKSVVEQRFGKLTGIRAELFGALVRDASVATTKLSSADQSIVSVADTTMHYYALNRRLDKFLDACTLDLSV